uniref:Uncharacterized protein n=2 Tax=Oryza TaxID=4527 RepID=A0A0D3F8C9_9ORYZ
MARQTNKQCSNI